MKTILFKNGKEIQMSEEDVKTMIKKMANSPSQAINNFEVFWSGEKFVNMINVSEISAIY